MTSASRPTHLSSLILALMVSITSANSAFSQDSEELQKQEERAIRAALMQVEQAVVQIQTFGGLDHVGETVVADGPTTGLIVSEEGYILSSAFNFANRPTQILVTLPGGSRVSAELVARDHARMLVLLQVETDESLPVAEVASRDSMAVGQWAIAVGRTFSADAPNVSVGIVSALHRISGKAVQTDAKISPSNYGGPLVDIHGRVIGILVPMSPQAEGETAGAEWYDSGIGFAVPLEEVLLHVETMKEGNDLYPGRLGIALEGNDKYSSVPLTAAVEPRSPADLAGIETGDKIVEVDGQPMRNQAQLYQALGRHYAGEIVSIIVDREGNRHSFDIELAGELRPYQHPFLGILPERMATADPGVVVRYVYPESGAAAAGILPGDRITSLADQEVSNSSSMQQQIATNDIGSVVAVNLTRAGQSIEVEVTLSPLPTVIPDALPLAQAEPSEGDPSAAVGVVDFRLPEVSNESLAYVPDTYNKETAHGLLVYLHAAGRFDRDTLLERFRSLCDENQVILLAPQAADASRWVPTEREFIRKSIDHLLATYTIDRTRVVVYGYQAGGTMAWTIGLGDRDIITGLVAVDAAPGLRAKIPASDPVHRLAVFVAKSDSLPIDSSTPDGQRRQASSDRINEAIHQLQQNNIPTTEIDLGDEPRELDEQQRADLFRWMDALDRI